MATIIFHLIEQNHKALCGKLAEYTPLQEKTAKHLRQNYELVECQNCYHSPILHIYKKNGKENELCLGYIK